MTDLNTQITATQTKLENDPSYIAARDAIRIKQDELKVKLRTLGEAFFKEQTAAVFAEHSELASFRWTQYTPWFNDGEPCEFNVYADEPRITTTDGTEYEYVSGPSAGHLEDDGFTFKASSWYAQKGEIRTIEDYARKYGEGCPVWAFTASSRIASLIYALDSDVLHSLFGDHCSVTVNRDGKIVVDEYGHD